MHHSRKLYGETSFKKVDYLGVFLLLSQALQAGWYMPIATHSVGYPHWGFVGAVIGIARATEVWRTRREVENVNYMVMVFFYIN